jgi:hypothetical protein
MKTSISSEIEIDAPPAAVWSVLADTARYGEWNPFILRVDGPLRPGARLEVMIAPPGGRRMRFRPTVRVVRTDRELRWLGRLLLPGLFDGEHRFDIEPLPGGRSRLTQSEVFSGLLARPLRSQLAPTELGFAQMNDALRARAEDAYRVSSRAAAAMPSGDMP